MKSFYCLIISLSIHLCGYAILPTQFHFRHYNIENGVSSNNISTLFQDQKGVYMDRYRKWIKPF